MVWAYYDAEELRRAEGLNPFFIRAMVWAGLAWTLTSAGLS